MRDQETIEKLKARGRRLEQVRVLARLSVSEAAEITQVAAVTYKDWEQGKHPMPERRIRFLLSALRLEGLDCSIEWITEGVGYGPDKIERFKVSEPRVEYIRTVGHCGETEQIEKELEVFYQGYSDAIDLTIEDDGMVPVYQVGDVVAGVKLYGKEIKQAFGVPCIVTTQYGARILRVVQEGQGEGNYTLLCLNMSTKQKTILHETNVVNVAPVLWHRKRKL